jgi:hypothetical protein
MTRIIGNFGRNTPTARWIVALAAGALVAAMAGAMPAAAQDPQATAAEIDNSLNYQAAAPSASPMYPSGAYAAAPRRYRSGASASTRGSGAYASAHGNEQPAPSTRPHKDFQDYK